MLEVKRDFLDRSSYPPQFKLALAHKDVVLAVTTASSHGLKLRIGTNVRRWFDLAADDQRGDQDFSAVVESENARLRSSRKEPSTRVD